MPFLEERDSIGHILSVFLLLLFVQFLTIFLFLIVLSLKWNDKLCPFFFLFQSLFFFIIFTNNQIFFYVIENQIKKNLFSRIISQSQIDKGCFRPLPQQGSSYEEPVSLLRKRQKTAIQKRQQSFKWII